MTKEEELFKAAEDGNIKKVKSMLNPKLFGVIKPVDVNITREDGWTLLMAAACNGHRDVVNLLMEKGAQVNAKTNDCFTPLMAAAKYGHKEIAELFLDHGADIHAAKTGQDAGENALMFAAWQGHKDVAELLIQRGADVNAKTPNGYTAMMSAAKFGKPDIARLLFEHGADIHAVKTSDEDPGWNAIFFASWQGQAEMVKWLIEKGADVNSRTANQWTPLLYAARDGHKEVVKLLLDGGADINAAQKDGWTALILAGFNGCHEIIRLLLDRGADIHVIAQDQLNALETAIEKDFADIAVTLIQHGADVTRIQADGSTLLHKTIAKGMMKVVTAILKTGKANVNGANKNGTTPLMKAVKANNGKAIELLLAHKPDVNLKDNKGFTALDLAGNGRSKKTVAMLEQAGAQYGVTTAPTGQEPGEKEGLPEISAAVTNIYLVDSSTIRPTGAGGSFFQAAIQCHNNRDDNGAARNFQKAIDAGLDKLRQGYAHANLGVLQLKRNEVAAAISHFIKVFALKEVLYESAHDAAQYMAVIYSELGRTDEAAQLEQVAYQTRARLGYSLAPDMAEKVRKSVRQQKNKLL